MNQEEPRDARSFLSQQSVDRHLCYFNVLETVNSSAVNISVHVNFAVNIRVCVSLGIKIFTFLRYMPKSGIAGSYGNSIFVFFIKEPLYCFPQCLHQFSFPTIVYKGLLLSTPLQNLICVLFLVVAILTGMELTMTLIYISQMISVAEHVFVCLLAFCMSSLEKCLFRSFAYFRYSAHFWIEFFVLFC